MVAPVCGLRPLRAARLLTKKLPNPVIATLSPLANAPEIAPVVADRARAASALVRPEPSAIAVSYTHLRAHET